MGIRVGSIIAIIIAVHIPTKDAAAPSHVCPGILIHAIDIVQPPGMRISPIAVMEAHHATVRAVLAAKSSANTQKNGLSDGRAETG
jgi:hypothetical protein